MTADLSRRNVLGDILAGLAGAVLLTGGAVTMAASDAPALPIDPRITRTERERQLLEMFRDLPPKARSAFLVHLTAHAAGQETFEEALLGFAVDGGMSPEEARRLVDEIKAKNPGVHWDQREVRS